MSIQNFKAAGFPWRLYCGRGALEENLKEAVLRAGAKRAFVVCSPSIMRRTKCVDRIATTLGDLYAGVFDAVENDATYTSVVAATKAARAADADILIAVGGGSVMMAARGTAIFLGEPGDPFDIMTQYPEGKPAFSPRLMASKLPIINIPTTPNTAINRAGTGLKNPDLDHRMEYFDPKTRPHSIILDEEALLATPASLIRSTATTVFAGLISSRAQSNANPLVAGDEEQAFRLAHEAYRALPDQPANGTLLINLGVAAFLRNRAEDDGLGRPVRGGAFSGNYAISTALHIRYPRVGQGESTSAIHGACIRLGGPVDPAVARRGAEALDVWQNGMASDEAVLAVAERLEHLYERAGMPTRLSQLDIPREDFSNLAAATVKNFNANAGARSPQAQVDDALKLLEAAY